MSKYNELANEGPNLIDLLEDTLLLYRFIRFEEEDFQFIEKFLRDNAKSISNSTFGKFVRFAVEFDRMEVINLFFNEGIFDTNSRSILAGEVLSQAARFYKTDLIDKILDRGFSIDQLNIRRETALYSAARFRQSNSIHYLCTNGAKVNFEVEIDRKYLTPLHIAAIDGNPDIIRTLIECGADVNARDTNGSTPLHYAVQMYRVAAIDTLIAGGADITIINNDGKTAIDIAKLTGNQGVVALLEATEKRLLEAAEKERNDRPATVVSIPQGNQRPQEDDSRRGVGGSGNIGGGYGHRGGGRL